MDLGRWLKSGFVEGGRWFEWLLMVGVLEGFGEFAHAWI